MPEVQETLRRLSEIEPGPLPVLSVYLDTRPQATGENPATRAGFTYLKDRLNEIEQTYWPRGPEFDSVRADAAHIAAYLEHDFPAEAQGLALFACAGRNLFETIAAGVPFDNQVTAGPAPDLFQLARLLDEQETAVAAVVDTNTARLFVLRRGFFEEVGGPDDRNTKGYRKRSMGGWNQMRYQRTIDNNRAAFARQAAAAIEELAGQVGAARVILAGDEVAIPLLREALSPPVLGLVQEPVLRVHIRAPREAVRAEVEPLLAVAEAEASAAAADRLVGTVRSGGLGVAGLARTRTALERGQADTLLLAADAPFSDEARGELVRLATATGAQVEVVEGHPGLAQLGGVGALLRYRT